MRACAVALSLAMVPMVAVTGWCSDAEADQPSLRFGGRSRVIFTGLHGTHGLGDGGGLRLEMGLLVPRASIPSTIALGLELGLMYSGTGALTVEGTRFSVSVPAAAVLSWRFELGLMSFGARAGVSSALVYSGTVRTNRTPSWSRQLATSALLGVHTTLPARSMGLFASLDLLLGRRIGFVYAAGLTF